MTSKEKTKPPGFFQDLAKEFKRHNISLFAAAIAFFGFIALIPALAATVSITGLVADTDDLVREAESALDAAPVETKDFLISQIESLADGNSAGLGVAAAVGVAGSLFSASSAIGKLMAALNVVFDREESRHFIILRVIAIGLVLGAVLLLAAMVFLMSILPELLDDWTGPGPVEVLITIGRFVGLALLMAAGLTVLYTVGPAPKPATTIELLPGGKRDLVSVGALVGTFAFVGLSWGFGVFVANFSSYGATYGTLATIVIVLLWLQVVSLAVLLGAEIDSVRAKRKIAAARSTHGLK